MVILRDIADRAKQDHETRAFTVADLEVRAGTDGTVTFDGIASVVDTAYNVRDMFGDYEETISKGAFTKTLKEKSDVRLLVNHNGVPLARTKSGTLALTAAPDLRAVANLDPVNPTVQEIRSAMSRGDMDQMSIGFRVRRQEWNEDYTERWIKEVELFDVSLVTYPASPTTAASLRSIEEFLDSLRDIDLELDDIVRAHKFFADLLPAPVAQEPERTSGLVVTDDLRHLWEQRKALIAA